MKPVKVIGQIFWARHDTPYDDGRYGVDIGFLSEKAIEKLQEEALLDVKYKDGSEEQQHYVTCRSNHPIKMVDMEGNPVKGRIGNHSECIAIVSPYEYTFKNKKGVGAGVRSPIVVTKLIPYAPKSSPEMDDLEAV